ncbi:MAG TPA: hypothetical protein PKW37_04070 [Salinivirgaceae bacterium]|nr:hypothetical protein [Salinivirgaceae bacterium]
MKATTLFVSALLLLCLCSSCGKTKYIPVETTKIELRDQLVRDSIFCYDSVFVKHTADTLFIEKYKYIYRDKIILDSVFIQDTVSVPYPVEVVKQVKAPLTSWQNFQIWSGRIALLLILLAIICFILKL